ncbi:three-Cys-motif partner protein TcmP [Nitratireductor sp. L15S-10]|uniref:three-Cys-motif partner protein TcmP n=1 Tax=Nitratireductor sp. L15S-10 TaxID=3034028 RepID=UPI0038579A57
MGDDRELFEDLPVLHAPQSINQSGLGQVWTQHKAQLIAKYIYLFTIITKHGAYIDGFSGPKNIQLENSWSAELVIETDPRRLRDIFLCDLEKKKVAHLRALVDRQQDRDKRRYEIHEGDFNEKVHDILGSGRIREKTATFCLIDQFTIECHWSTLQALAGHKPKGSRKIEIFYFLATGWLHRSLSGHTANPQRPDLWWGGNGWQAIKTKSGDRIAVRMAERFRDELGYRYVKPYPIFQRDKGGGKIMFHMIHASDHPDAAQLMARAHRNVTRAPETEEQLKLALSKITP